MQAFKGTVRWMIDKSAARQWYAKVSVSQINIANLIFAGTVGTIVYLVLGPMIFLLWSSFRSALPPRPIGTYTFDNYVFAYSSPMTYHLFLNTIVFSRGIHVDRGGRRFCLCVVDRTPRHPRQENAFHADSVARRGPFDADGYGVIILAGPEARIINVIFHQLFGFKPINIFSRSWLFALNGLHSVPATFSFCWGRCEVWIRPSKRRRRSPARAEWRPCAG